MADMRNESRRQASWRVTWATRENQRRLSKHAAAEKRWRADLQDLDQMLEAARSFDGLSVPPDVPLALKRGERVFMALPMVTLIEGTTSAAVVSMDTRFSWRGTRTREWESGSRRSGPTTMPEGMRALDSGPVTLTDRRIVFHGSKHGREWSFAKLSGLENSSNGPYTVLQVSNRKKPSGVLYPPSAATGWRFNLALALAVFAHQREVLVADLERERHELLALRPVMPPVALPEEAPSYLALAHGVKVLYVGRPGQAAGRRVAQGTIMGVVTLLALSIVGGLASTPSTTVQAGQATPFSKSATQTSTTSAAPAPTVVASVTSRPAPSGPRVKVPPPRPRITAAPKPTTKPTTRPTTKPTTRPTRPRAKPTPKPTPTRAAVRLCGAPSNPWGYTFCGGAYITSPPSDFCAYFDCIPNFPKGQGYVEQCVDGMFSQSGGRQGACSHHGGERRPLFR